MTSHTAHSRIAQIVRFIVPVLAVVVVCLCVAVPAMAEFGLYRFGFGVGNRGGSPDVQAGSHPYSLTTTFVLNPGQDPKDTKLELPPGFVGDPNATPRCTYAEFVKKETGGQTCANETAVGVATVYLTDPSGEGYPLSTPVYNLVPARGVAAEFGFFLTKSVPVLLTTSVRTGGDYGLTETSSDVPQAAVVLAAKVTIWGVPANPAHNLIRGECERQYGGVPEPVEEVGRGLREGEAEVETPIHWESEPGYNEEVDAGLPEPTGASLAKRGCPSVSPEIPLLTNPTSCGVPRSATLKVDSWEEPGDFEGSRTKTAVLPELAGCESLDFSPTISVTSDGTAGSTPTGLNVDVHVPQEATENPVGLAEADMKNTTVALPEGVQISPGAADGLQACSPLQIGLHTAERPACPDASKVGNVEVTTPLLPEPLTGGAYLATQDENPFGSLIALYLVFEDPVAGVLVKVAGQVSLNPVTGQLVTTFKETPQFPYNDFKLDVLRDRSGAVEHTRVVRDVYDRKRRLNRGRGPRR